MVSAGEPGKIATPEKESGVAQVRADRAQPIKEPTVPGSAAETRRRTGEIRRRAGRSRRLRTAANRMIWGPAKADGADRSRDASRDRSWSTVREILSEIVLPLLGLALVSAIAAFWANP